MRDATTRGHGTDATKTTDNDSKNTFRSEEMFPRPRNSAYRFYTRSDGIFLCFVSPCHQPCFRCLARSTKQTWKSCFCVFTDWRPGNTKRANLRWLPSEIMHRGHTWQLLPVTLTLSVLHWSLRCDYCIICRYQSSPWRIVPGLKQLCHNRSAG